MASQEQIDDALKNHPGYMGSIGSDQLPDWSRVGSSSGNAAPSVFSYVVNMSTRNDPDGGTHWLAVWGKDGKGYWFDSYGNAPDVDDRLLGKKTYFREWLNKVFGPNWTYNTIDLQSYDPSDVCGEWSVTAVRIGTLPTKTGPPGTQWYPLMYDVDSGKGLDARERDRRVFKLAGMRKEHLRGMTN